MWPKGYEIRWFRREMPRKYGPAPPSRPGFGQTPLRVMQDGDRYYVGTAYVMSSGAEKPYTVESEYFRTEKMAMDHLRRMTGKNITEILLRCFVRELLREDVIGGDPGPGCESGCPTDCEGCSLCSSVEMSEEENSRVSEAIRLGIRGFLKESFITPQYKRDFQASGLVDSILGYLEKLRVFDRGIPVSLVNSIECHAYDMLADCDKVLRSIRDPSGEGFEP